MLDIGVVEGKKSLHHTHECLVSPIWLFINPLLKKAQKTGLIKAKKASQHKKIHLQFNDLLSTYIKRKRLVCSRDAKFENIL